MMASELIILCSLIESQWTIAYIVTISFSQDLLAWLRQRRAEGYHVVGLEQTSSSVSLGSYAFPNQPTILLLGKEKEGIPVEFLQAVDQCLEIPQLGESQVFVVSSQA